MIFKQLYWFIFLKTCFVLFASVLFAQDLVFKNINKENGLPGAEVFKIIQDRKGYIWGITEGGVFRYNGAAYKVFTIEEGLSGYTFFNLREDFKGRIWVSSFEGKVGYFIDDKFYNIEGNDSLSYFLQFGNKLIYDLYVDKADVLWLGTAQKLIKIVPEDNYSHLEEVNAKNDSIRRIIFEPDSGFLISSNCFKVNAPPAVKFTNGVATEYADVLTKSFKKVVKFSYSAPFLVFPFIRQALTPNGDLLFTYQNTIYIVNKNGQVSEKLFDHQIIELIIDKHQNLWVCFAKGGVQLFSNCNLKREPREFFDGITISDVLIDNEDGLWMSTLGNGVYYSPTLMATVFSTPASKNKIIGISKVDDSIYAVNLNHQFVVIDSAGNCSFKGEIARPFSSDRLKIVLQKKEIFLCGGITGWFDKNLIPLSLLKNENGGNLNAQDVTFGDNDSLYVLTHSDLYFFYKSAYLAKKQLPARGRVILKAGIDNFFIGTLNGLYTLKEGKFYYAGKDNERLKTRINYLYADSQKRIWVCTKGSGLLFYENNTWHSISKENGLVSNLCNSIIEAEHNVFYVSTQNGISRINLRTPSNFAVENYTASNGLPSEEVICLEYYKGKLYAGTQNGLAKINTALYWQNNTPPPVYLNKIILNDSINITENTMVTKFNHDQNNFIFNVDVLSFKDAKKLRIKYELRGAMNLTRESGSDKIELQNLKPGAYTLSVWGINNNGVASKEPAQFQFTIQKPFWLMWWFITAEVVTALVLIFLFIKWRSSVIQKENKEQFEMEKKLSAFQLQALRAQMNPHFVFNAINSIQSQILQKKQHEAYSYLTKFSQLIRLILVNTNEDSVALSKEIEAIRLYIELEQLRFDEKFEFDFHIDKSVDEENIIIPSMIIQPFLENAIWHGLMPLNGIRKAKLSMHISTKDEKLCVIIEDNGIGRKKSSAIKKTPHHQSLGISLTQQRLELTAITGSKISINDVTDTNNAIAGTRVEILI